MEAWKDEPRVRPIPIEDDSSSDLGFDAPEPPDEPPRRPWLPLALSAIAVVMIIGSVATFGAIQDDDPVLENDAAAVEGETTTSSTTTTIPLRTLEETVPGLTSRLTLIAQGPDGPTALLWDPSFVQPKAFPIEYNPEHTARFVLDDAAFDASGDFVRILGSDTATETSWMWVGSPADVAAVDIPNVRGAVWHAHDVHQLAWVTDSGDGDWTLDTARLNPLSLQLQPNGDQMAISPESRLIRWDRNGFVINEYGDEPSVVALDPDGVELWRADGEALAASDTTVLIGTDWYFPGLEEPTDSVGGESIVTSVVSFDREGTPYATALDEGAAAEQAHRSMWITSTTDFMARVDVRGQSTTLEITGGNLVSVRKLRQNDDVLPLGFIDNDGYFTFASDGGNDLIFVNWNVGSIHEVLVPDGFKVVGFSTG